MCYKNVFELLCKLMKLTFHTVWQKMLNSLSFKYLHKTLLACEVCIYFELKRYNRLR